MKELYLEGMLGSFEYGEGEYMHNCEDGWDILTRAEPTHWRNTMSAFYYCTHSLGPLIHITGLRPVSVTGFEAPHNARMQRMGALGGAFGVEIVTLENGAILKSTHGVGPSKNSTWYTIYGSKGRMESARVDTEKGEYGTLYVNCDKNEGDNNSKPYIEDVSDDLSEVAEKAGHGGSDYHIMYNMVTKLRGNRNADVIDIYGFTEQMGLNYPDCECGWKHTSSYVRVLVRDTVTREVLPPGKEGLLEFITPVPHSYPGNAVLTDDLGIIDSESCKQGRAGTRFKIVGRMKKAEIRGCGDILSQKLTFQKKEKTAQTGEAKLEVYLHQHPITVEEPLAQLKEIVDSLKQQQEWLNNQPVEAIIGLIGEVAKKWATDPKLMRIKDRGLLFLSTWCDEKHLRSVANMGLRGNIDYMDKFLPFPDSDKHYLKANARGLVCHWLAGNVQILGMFALVQCIISKNVNLLKVSSRDDGVFTDILNEFKGVSYTTEAGHTILGDDLMKTIAVVYFNRYADKLGEEMSKQADVRIAWGGRESVETVSGYPARYDAETVIFGPKLSYSVIAKEELSSVQEAKKLARKVSVDVSVFDQTGCASPHNLYVEEGGVVSPEEFIDIVGDSMQKTELQIPKPLMSPEQVSQIHSIRGVYDFKGTVKGSETMSWTILLDDLDEIDKPVYSRVLFMHKVKSIFDSLKYIDENTQTIGIAAPTEKAIEFATEATKKGVMRLPLIGRMLNFEMPWDGIFLFDRLVKWNTYGGPLR